MPINGRELVRLMAGAPIFPSADPTALLAKRLKDGASSGGFNGIILETLLEETSIGWEYQGAYINGMESHDPLYIGTDAHIITIDGASYRCDTWSNQYGDTCMGDSRLMLVYDDNGNEIQDNTHPEDVPFAIQSHVIDDDFEETHVWFILFSDQNTHTVKIERERTIPKREITITGNETFNFQAANNTVYYKNSKYVSVPHENIVYASCTHFSWGDGDVIANMEDGEFIFNYTKATGMGTGNISFKKNDIFTSAAAAKAWFVEQADKGTPVTISCWVK